MATSCQPSCDPTNNPSGQCLVCKGPENEKCKWLQCLKCREHGHSTCVRMTGLKSPACEINWVCDVCANEIKGISNLFEEFLVMKSEMEEIKKLLQKTVPNMEQTVTTAVHEAVIAASEAVGQGDNEDELDSPLPWVDVVTKGRRKKMKQEKKLLIIKSEDQASATARKDEVGQALDDVQVLDSKFTKAGKIVVNFETDEARKMAEDKLKAVGNISVSYGKKLHPKFMLCNVGEEEKRETLIEHLVERNDFLSTIPEVKDKMKVLFQKPAAGGTFHYIIKCDPEVRGLIHRMGDKLCLKWGRHKIYDRYHALICFFCLKFGHKADKCPAKANHEHPKCYKCAEAHDGYSCRSTERKCANCRAVKRHDDHSVTGLSCPIFAAELTRIRDSTDHGW